MSIIGAKYNNRVLPGPPRSLYSKVVGDAVSTGTYQITDTSLLNRVCVFVCDKACYIQGGTGAAVTSTAKCYLPANTAFYYTPKSGMESLGWVTVDGSNVNYLSIYTQDTLGEETV